MTLTLPVLTPEDITRLLSETRTRGEYLVAIEKFVDSGELAMTLNAPGDPFAGKAASAVRQSIDGNITKHGKDKNWPALKVILTGDEDSKVAILINMDVHAASVAAPAATDAE